ncbi:hypothetical protein D3C80_1717780 [compost metagenome]
MKSRVRKWPRWIGWLGPPGCTTSIGQVPPVVTVPWKLIMPVLAMAAVLDKLMANATKCFFTMMSK